MLLNDTFAETVFTKKIWKFPWNSRLNVSETYPFVGN